MIWMILCVIFGLGLVGSLLSIISGSYTSEIFTSIAIMLVLFLLSYKKYKDHKDGTTKEKKAKKQKEKYESRKEIPGTKERNNELGASTNIMAKHIAGLPVAEGMDCFIYLCNDKIIFERNGSTYNLLMDKINDISIKTDVEIQKAYVSSVGGAIGGAVLFGPLGAMVGGRAKAKTTRNLQKFLIFTYEKEENVDYISFDVTNAPGSNAFIKHFQTLPKKKKNIEL